jgi:hypothetical protein
MKFDGYFELVHRVNTAPDYLFIVSMWVSICILLVTQCTIVLIRKNIGCLARYEFYWPDIFRIRTIVHCVTNVSWFCNHTSYLMFSILGQWIYHDFESIQPCISSFSFPWDMEFVMVLSPYFTSDCIFFHIMTINLSCFCIHIIKFNIKSTV